MNRPLAALSWIAILLLAAALRLPAVSAARPYMTYVDEGNLVHPAARTLRAGGWDPAWYLYPSLPINAIAAGARLYEPFYQEAYGKPLREDIESLDTSFYNVIEPFELLVIGRMGSLLAGLGTVLFTGLLARRLAGPRAGLFAAFLAALAPPLVIRSGIVTVDAYAALFVTACLFFTDRTRTSRRPWLDALLAGAMAGCAFTSKYPTVLVSLAFALTVLLAYRSWRERLRLWTLGGLGAIAGAALVMPALATHPAAVLDAIRSLERLYDELTSPPLWRQAILRAEWDLPFEHPELGVVYLLLAAAGLWIALRDRDVSPSAWGWVLYGGIALALCMSYSFQPFRNLLPLVPMTCVAISLLLEKARERIARPVWVHAAAVLLIAVLFGRPVAEYALERRHYVDSRTQAADWLAARSWPQDTVLVLHDLTFQPSELERIPGNKELRRWSAIRNSLNRLDARFLVYGELQTEQGERIIRSKAHKRIRERYDLRAQFGEHATPPFDDWWRNNRQIIYVMERRGRR
jgi:4-amino-4-deoxy-L-arabinose transferase-like glycosyltransferase